MESSKQMIDIDVMHDRDIELHVELHLTYD